MFGGLGVFGVYGVLGFRVFGVWGCLAPPPLLVGSCVATRRAISRAIMPLTLI